MGDEVLRAAREGRGEDVIRTLEQDPSLIHVTDHTDSHGDTILHLVSRSAAHDAELVRELVKFLEDKGLRKVLLEQNSDGNTPLHLALFTHPVNHLAVDHLYWANPKAQDVVNEDGVSPRLLIPKDILQDPPVKVSSSDIEMRSVYQALDGDEDEDEDEETIDLSLAVKRGKEYLVQQILEEDPSLIWYKDPWLQWRPYPNATWYKRHKWTPLHDAARAGRVTMLKLLLRFMTPYHELMSSTLSGDQTDTFNSMTPLGITLHKGHKEAAFYLIETAPHTAYQVNLSGTSPLHLAVQKGYQDIVRYIFQLMPANAVSSSVKDSLFAAQKKKSVANAAIKTANIGILEAIMEELPDLINMPDSKGWRPLSYAAYRGYLQGVCYLLAKFPAYVKKYDWDGSLPIHKAVGGGHISVVKSFCSHWPETLSKVDRKGRSVLHYAVMCAKADVLQYLTEELQVQVSKLYSLRDYKGNTFLDLANELKILGLDEFKKLLQDAINKHEFDFTPATTPPPHPASETEETKAETLQEEEEVCENEVFKEELESTERKTEEEDGTKTVEAIEESVVSVVVVPPSTPQDDEQKPNATPYHLRQRLGNLPEKPLCLVLPFRRRSSYGEYLF